MSMEIVKGEFYRSANGEKVGPMMPAGAKFIRKVGDGFSWNPDGTCHVCYGGVRSDHQLVSKWEDGPVRTVTRREVVEWSDDVLTVVPHEDGHILIGFKHPHDQHYISLSKKQMLSACMIMSQIAEAMDDGESK